MAENGDRREPVLIGYGEVMSVVQLWEQALALIWWRAERKHKKRPSGDFDTERSQREIMRLEAAFLRTPAQAIREAVAPHLEADTASNLEGLIAERNRLAHRFLREQNVGKGTFKAGTQDQLIALGNAFMESLDSIAKSLMADYEPYDGPVPDHWPAIAERIAERLFGGNSVPRDPRQQ
jgi:hypothetical protein